MLLVRKERKKKRMNEWKEYRCAIQAKLSSSLQDPRLRSGRRKKNLLFPTNKHLPIPPLVMLCALFGNILLAIGSNLSWYRNQGHIRCSAVFDAIITTRTPVHVILYVAQPTQGTEQYRETKLFDCRSNLGVGSLLRWPVTIKRTMTSRRFSSKLWKSKEDWIYWSTTHTLLSLLCWKTLESPFGKFRRRSGMTSTQLD